MATELELAYAAGMIDSDGCIGVSCSTYAMRVTGDASQPVYFERVTLKQVEPQGVDLLTSLFGGCRFMTDLSAKRGRPLHSWHIHSAMAGKAIVLLVPYLRIKAEQAKNTIRLRQILKTQRGWHVPPIIPGEPLVSATEFAAMVGAKQRTILQAAWHGSIPTCRIGRNRMIPVSYMDTYRSRMATGGKAKRAQYVTDELEACYQRAKELNRVGVR